MTGWSDWLAGHCFLNNRYHDPTLGSFISVDPLVSVTQQPYAYGNNNPIRYSDPTGLCAADTGNAREACSAARSNARGGAVGGAGPGSGSGGTRPTSSVGGSAASGGTGQTCNFWHCGWVWERRYWDNWSEGWSVTPTPLKAVLIAIPVAGGGLLICAVGSVACAASASRIIPGVTAAGSTAVNKTGGDPGDEVALLQESLQALAKTGGPTTRLVTNLNKAPEAGRALSTWNDPSLAPVAGNSSSIFQADIPKALLMGLQDNHLLFIKVTNMNGVTGQEYRFAPEAAQFIVGFFEQIV
jgi:RHS repeat-associated protein